MVMVMASPQLVPLIAAPRRRAKIVPIGQIVRAGFHLPFRVPLHGKYRRFCPRSRERLDRSIGGDGVGNQAGSKSINRLVVNAVDQQFGLSDIRGERRVRRGPRSLRATRVGLAADGVAVLCGRSGVRGLALTEVSWNA